jgi:hypothetical protein
MSDKIVYQGQTFLDKVLETTGSIENAFEMSLLNGCAVTDDFAIGAVVSVSLITNAVLANSFSATNRPASSSAALNIPQDSIGIGKMIIGKTFTIR